jgi:alanine racemase
VIDRNHPGNGPWIELSASAVRKNVELFRALLSKAGSNARFGAVLKGNAYGHGLNAMLPLAHEHADVLYVITPQDAFAVRAYEGASHLPRKQVVVIGAIVADEAVELAREGIDAVIADGGWAEAGDRLRQAKLERPLRCHVHLDTGLGREGFTPTQLPEAIELLRRYHDVFQVAGVLSHFANTEDVTEQEYADTQLAAFEAGFALLQEAIDPPALVQRHFAASAATMVLPPARFDVVRVGIALYGLWPSTETRLSARLVLGDVPHLHPVLSWRCRSQVVKWLPAGSYVGYGCTYRCSQDTRVAVLPLGYFDGYPRLLSGKAHVLVNGRRCPVLGRVMMNHVVVDVTHASASEAPVVATLLGTDATEQISADTLAGWAQTINYEVVTRLGPHIRRVVIH